MLDRRAFLYLLLAGAVAPGALAACGAKGTSEPEPEPESTDEPMAGMPNPFVDCDSAYETAQLAGFEVTFPESVPGYSERFYQAIEGQMAQCFYVEGEQRVLIRKATDDGSGDISGDYTEYPSVVSVSVGDVEVTEKGDGTLVFATIWERDGYLFAIDSDAGLEPAVVEGLVAATW